VWPLVKSLFLSLEQSYGPAHTQFVGAMNYRFILTDPLFWNAVVNTLYFALGSVFLQLPLALGLALLLNRPGLRGRLIYRTIFFAPYLVGLVFAALMFAFIFEKRTGLMNRLLNAIFPAWNIDFPWLQDHVMWSLVLIGLWLYVGLNMVYFLAALQNVSPELLDAANIDGAGPWQRFRHIILPEILPVGSFVVLLSIIGSLQLFELPWVLLTSPDQPIPDERGWTVVVYLYERGFIAWDLGYASAVGWILAAVLIGIAMLQRRILRGREEHLT
jgi:ABC-type sugar transport system permease subunit